MLLIILKKKLKCLLVLSTFAFILFIIHPKAIWAHMPSNSITTKSPDISRMANAVYENVTNLTNALQKTTCSIVSGDAQLRAEAVLMQMPRIPCPNGSDLISLEKRLTQQLDDIKQMLQELANSCKCFDTQSTHIHNATDPNAKQKNGGVRSTTPKLFKYQTTQASWESPHLRKAHETPSMQQKNLSFDEHSSVFTYYWNLKNFTEHLRNGFSSTLDSPSFTIKGKDMSIKVYFRHLQRDFIYVQLCEAKKSKRNGIQLEVNDSFQEIANNIRSNTFRYTISILNQNNGNILKDNNLISQEFHQLNSGLLIPNSALLESPYIKNNSILIQIVMYA